MISLVTPTIHLNGSGKDNLLNDYLDAIHGVRTAIEALAGTVPHARDYYVQGGDSYKQARKQFEDRMQRLQSVKDELDAIAEKIAEVE